MPVEQKQLAEVALLFGQERLATKQRRVGARGCPGTGGGLGFGQPLGAAKSARGVSRQSTLTSCSE